MEDNIQILVYIVFGIIYLLFKAFQKKNKPENRNPTEGDLRDESEADMNQPRHRPQPKSFEEMLREFSGEAAEIKEEVKEEVKPKVEEVRRKKQAYNPRPDVDDEVKRNYDKSVEEGKKIKTLNDTIDLDKINRERANAKLQTEELEEANASGKNEYASMLQSLDGAKKAFVMTEIFNRKYK